MNRLLPRTLFGQALLTLLLGLIVSNAIGAWIYIGARSEAVRAVGGLAAAQRIANVVHLIEDAPPEWRDRLVAGASDPTFRVTAVKAPPRSFDAAQTDASGTVFVEDFLRQELGRHGARQIKVALGVGVGPPMGTGPGRGMHGPMMRAGAAWRGLDVAYQTADGSWLTFTTSLPDTGPALSPRLILAIAVMAAITGLVASWTVRRITAPLGTLALAAHRLGRDVHAQPLVIAGSLETQAAAQAFNEMQGQLRRLIENRTQMLAAISHDLRTQLTLLRLRAETAEPREERERMLATIGEMDEMLQATMDFARDQAKDEPRRRTDVSALLASIVDDLADAGLPVKMSPAEPFVLDCQPMALRRAMTNLIDNAIKYGKSAAVDLAATPDGVTMSVADEGPGIPAAELSRVVQPFYRLEVSRSRETGGMGLGLAIAQAIATAHGGRLVLANRPEGGLRASIALPR